VRAIGGLGRGSAGDQRGEEQASEEGRRPHRVFLSAVGPDCVIQGGSHRPHRARDCIWKLGRGSSPTRLTEPAAAFASVLLRRQFSYAFVMSDAPSSSLRSPRHPNQDARVFLFDCDTYDVGRIRSIVGAAMKELGLAPTGRTLVKPNLVCAG